MFKSKFLGRAVSIIMIVALCFCSLPQGILAAEPAYALSGTMKSLTFIMEDDVAWTSDSTSGQIDVKLAGPSEGTVFTAYRLLDISNVGGVLNVSIPADAQPFWQSYVTASGIASYSGTGDVTIAHIKAAINTRTGAAEQSNSIVTEFVDFAGSKPADAASGTVTGNKATINTTFGFYIIQQTQAPAGGYIASAPVLACLPMQKVDGGDWIKSYTVIPKDDQIAISKNVKATGDATYLPETIAEIDDTLSYEIIADLPEYGYDITSSAITYELTDTLPNSIAYDDGSVEVTFKSKTGMDYTTLGGYVASYDAGTRKITLTVGNYAANINGQYDKVKITYNAKLKSNDIKIEDTGNINTAVLEYTSAKGATKTIDSSAKVYTLELDITKVDNEDTSVKLAGAEFQVYGTEAEAADPANAIKFIDISGTAGYENGKHYRVATSEEIAAGTNITTDIKVADDPIGTLKIYGLNNQEYFFKEITAPTGYNLPSDLFTIAVKPEAWVDAGTPGDYNDLGELNFNATRQSELIKNSSGIDLPVTGGIGTVIFTAVGLLLMVGAVYFLLGKKKSNN